MQMPTRCPTWITSGIACAVASLETESPPASAAVDLRNVRRFMRPPEVGLLLDPGQSHNACQCACDPPQPSRIRSGDSSSPYGGAAGVLACLSLVPSSAAPLLRAESEPAVMDAASGGLVFAAAG